MVKIDQIVKEQYILSRRANISIIESNLLPDFERQAFLNLVLKELDEEAKALEG